MLWQQVLAALHDPDATHREQLLAVGAAALAHARRTDDHPADAETVCRIALEELGILLDAATATTALTRHRAPSGRAHEVPVPEETRPLDHAVPGRRSCKPWTRPRQEKLQEFSPDGGHPVDRRDEM
ncbi:hypothetical protein [Streptomyces sp. NPDC055632]